VVREALAPRRPVWTEIEPAPGRLSLVATLPHPDGPGRRPTLIINGHLDVVPVRADQWDTDPFTPTEADGRLYGRGSADMKGGIAAAICALELLDDLGVAPAWDVVFHLVADEEVGGTLGTRALLEAGLITGDACLVPEPTGLGLCIAERGLMQSYVTVHGVPGHGSRPKEGVSAIAHAAALTLALHAADFDGPDHPLLGRPSANVGTVVGGSGINTVAESCRLGVDRRVLPGATEESTVAELRARIDAAGVAGLRYDLDVVVFGEASELPAGHPWTARVGRAVAAATGTEPPTIGMTFTTDARFVRNQAGIPTVVCGPGEVAQAHTNNEWVACDQLGDAVAAYAHLLADPATD
jgi:acetylornithine deacetylase/succinyl-diaminopimelate desuccinylase family protein